MDDVTLSEVTLSDAPELIQAHIESQESHCPWVETFHDRAGFEEWFARLKPDKMVSFIARHRGGGIVGLCTLSEIVRGGFQSAYLGFHGMARFARRGLMTEAVRLTARQAFDGLQLHRLEANGLGFTREGYSRDYLKIRGRWSDHVRWALLASDFEA
jgi:ribosomal-protein-alanine N-acetyltransferase